MDFDFDVGIVGAGPGGLTCALYLGRAGYSVTVFERMFAGGQAAVTDQIDNYPGLDHIAGAELGAKMQAQAAEFGAQFAYEDVQALSLQGEIKHIITAGKDYACRAVVLCMGARPKLLGVPGEERLTGRGISYCATCDGAFFKHRDVAVVGGGNTAVKDALYLAKFAKSVTVLHRRDELRAKGREVAQMLNYGNVQVRYGVIVEEILGENAVEALRLRLADGSEERMPMDGVFIAVGTQPQTELVQDQLSLEDGGWIPAGEDCKTQIPGVYAVGDLRTKPLRQVITAAADGANAAASIQELLQG